MLALTIEANAVTLVSKTMFLDDREALQRQMTIRIAHQRLLQRRLDRLTPGRDEPPDICANEQPFDKVGILSLRRIRWYPLPDQLVVRHSMKELSRARTLSTPGEISVGTCPPR